MPSAAQQAMDDPETRSLFEESWPKECGCCNHEYSEEEWEKLRYCGLQKVPPDLGMSDFELRACGNCGNTMAISVPGDFVEKD